MKRFILFLLAAGLALSPVVAQTVSKDPITVKWMSNMGKPNPDAPVLLALQDLLTKKLGYTVKIETLGGQGSDADLKQAINVMYAANDLPDVFRVFSLADEKFNNNATAHFTMEEYKTYMPNSYKFNENLRVKLGLTEKEAWGNYLDEKGLLIGAPKTWDMGPVPELFGWRQDILDDLGIKTVPTTLAEVDKAFAAFKVKYPTKYPYGTHFKGLAWQFGELVFGAYGLERRDGEWVKGPNGKYIRAVWHPDIKKALTVLADWYKKGYLSPEFYTQTNAMVRDAFKTGDWLVNEHRGSGSWAPNPGDLVDTLVKTVPGAKVTIAGFPRVEKNGPVPVALFWSPFLTQVAGFGKSLGKDRDKLHKVMQVADLIGCDQEVTRLARFGIEGKHYTIPAGEVATVGLSPYKEKTAVENTTNEGYGGTYWGSPLTTETFLYSGQKSAIKKNFEDPNGIAGTKNLRMVLQPGPIWKAIEDEQGNDVSKPLVADTSISFENVIAPIILGAKPITHFDDMYQRYLKNGGEKEEFYANKMINGK